VLGGLHLLLYPTGTDLAAQQARASFARDFPLTPVDLSWYGGVHPFSYSLLSPTLMAGLGVALTGLVAAVACAVLLARLMQGTARPLAGALVGAVFAVANTVSGRATFALGAVAALAALVLLPRRGPAGAAAVLSGLFSPVAAAFLGLAAAVLVLRRRPGGWTLGLCASLPVVALGLLFPAGGIQPYETSSAPYAVVAGLVLALLTHSPSLRVGGLLYAATAAVLLLVADPFGSNILRLGLLLAAPLVVATATDHPRVVAPVAAALVLWQLQPTLSDLVAPDPPPFAALNAALVEQGAKRVEVVPLRDHGEAAKVAPVVPLARGWSRQEDTARNPLFYDGNLSAERFERWLLDEGVDHVALAPDARLDGGGRAERALLLIGSVPGLREVWADDDWLVWRVETAEALAPPPLRVVRTDRTTVRLLAEAAGVVPLKVRWSRWLTVTGPACVERDGDTSRLRVSGPGEIVVSSRFGLSWTGRCTTDQSGGLRNGSDIRTAPGTKASPRK
jgi:hypothetical protein